MTMLNLSQFADQRTRGYLYRLLTAVGALLLGYGAVTTTELALWTGVVASLFGIPAYNTPVKAPLEPVHVPACNEQCNPPYEHYLEADS